MKNLRFRKVNDLLNDDPATKGWSWDTKLGVLTSNLNSCYLSISFQAVLSKVWVWGVSLVGKRKLNQWSSDPQIQSRHLFFPPKLYFIELTLNLWVFFFFGCSGSSLLWGLFSSCGEQGLVFVAVRRLLIAVASLVQSMGFTMRGLQ